MLQTCYHCCLQNPCTTSKTCNGAHGTAPAILQNSAGLLLPGGHCCTSTGLRKRRISAQHRTSLPSSAFTWLFPLLNCFSFAFPHFMWSPDRVQTPCWMQCFRKPPGMTSMRYRSVSNVSEASDVILRHPSNTSCKRLRSKYPFARLTSIPKERRVSACVFLLREAMLSCVSRIMFRGFQHSVRTEESWHSLPGEAAAQLSVWGERLLATILDHKWLHLDRACFCRL